MNCLSGRGRKEETIAFTSNYTFFEFGNEVYLLNTLQCKYRLLTKYSIFPRYSLDVLTFPTQFKGILPEPGCFAGSALGLGKPTSLTKT